MDKAMNRDGLKRLWARALATFGTATAMNVTVVLPASGWSSTVPYTQTVAAPALLATDDHCPADIDMSGRRWIAIRVCWRADTLSGGW